MSGRVAAPAAAAAAAAKPWTLVRAHVLGDDARVCAELVLRIVQNTRNNLWTGHDDDWNIYSARYARCTLYDGIFVAAGVPAAARSGITVPYFKHDPPQERDGSVLQERATAIVVSDCAWRKATGVIRPLAR